MRGVPLEVGRDAGGLFKESQFDSHAFQLKTGDVLVAYTDGTLNHKSRHTGKMLATTTSPFGPSA